MGRHFQTPTYRSCLFNLKPIHVSKENCAVWYYYTSWNTTCIYVDIVFQHSNYWTISQGICWSVPKSTTPILQQHMFPCVHWLSFHYLFWCYYFIYSNFPIINNAQHVGMVIDFVLCWNPFKFQVFCDFPTSLDTHWPTDPIIHFDIGAWL